MFMEHYNFVKLHSKCELLETWIDKKRWYKLRCFCGNVYEVSMQKFKRKDGQPQIQCQECGVKIRAEKNTKTNEQYVQELLDKNIGIINIEPYKGVATPIYHRCPVCEKDDWKTIPKNVLGGLSTKCPDCHHANLPQTQAYTDIEYQELKKVKGINIVNVEEYINNHTPIQHICPKCGDDKWYVRPGAILRVDNPGTMCEPCSYILRGEEKLLTNKEVNNTIIEAGCKWVSGEYQGIKSILTYLCSCKEHHFDRRYSDFRNGINRCLHCSNKVSYGEQEIINFLELSNVNYIHQYSFKDLINPKTNRTLSFDFAILKEGEIKALVEYDGELHYKAIELFGGDKGLNGQQKRDAIKDEYCYKNNLKLIRIPYWEKENIRKILESVV